jgi:hypothetical protein
MSTTERFDKEISLKGLVWTSVGLAALTVLAQFLMWWLLVGFEKKGDRQDPKLSPIEAGNPQQEPPEPRLQVTQGFARNNPALPPARSEDEDMAAMREEEAIQLGKAAWLDPKQGTVRVPIDVAMDVIARRGVAPLAAPEPAALVEETPKP